ncbi:hypothetical protein K438DRAFT_1772454 [Mycena galopus ATCC 62051]|nr:hypothetical protein K438DRAFT_1772454 [Mycena galopus ATCC 62051]
MPIFQGVYTITNLKSHIRFDLNGGKRPQLRQILSTSDSLYSVWAGHSANVQGWEVLPPTSTLLPDRFWGVQYTCKLGIDSYTISDLKSGTYLENKGVLSTSLTSSHHQHSTGKKQEPTHFAEPSECSGRSTHRRRSGGKIVPFCAGAKTFPWKGKSNLGIDDRFYVDSGIDSDPIRGTEPHKNRSQL